MRLLFTYLLIFVTLFCLVTIKSLSLDMTHLSKESGIYCIENIVTKEKYVGESSNPYRRRREHLSRFRNGKHSNRKLQEDYYKYGEDNLKFYSLVSCEKELRLELEQFYIKELKAEYNNNLHYSKDGEPTYYELMVKAGKERWKVPGYKEKIIANWIKAIEQLDLKTGKVIAEYPSTAEASRVTGLGKEAIGSACRGSSYISGGFRWRFKGEEEKGSPSIWEKKVLAKDKKTLEVIGKYNSIKEASENTGCGRSNISDCLANRIKSSKGLLWTYI